MIRDRFTSRSLRRRVDGHRLAGDQPATPPSSQDFTSALRSRLARELTDHDPDTDRIRARMAVLNPSMADQLTPATPVAELPAIPAPTTTESARTTKPAETTAPPDTSKPAGTAVRPAGTAYQRPRRTRARALAPALIGTTAAVLVGVVLLSGTLFPPQPDTGTVTAAPTRIPRGAAADTGGAPSTGGLGASPAPSSPAPPGPAPNGAGPAVLNPEGVPSQEPGASATPPGAPDGSAHEPDRAAAPGAGSAPLDARPGDDGAGDDNGDAPGRDDQGRSGGRDGSRPENRDSRGNDVAPGRDGARRDSGSGGGVSASTAPFGRADQVNLPTAGCLDWVLFGAGGVQTRADIPRPAIGTARVDPGAGPGTGGFANRFSWTGGRPVASGARDDDRLAIRGTGRLDVSLATQTRRLDLYLGSSDGDVRVVVGDGRNAWSRVVALSPRQQGYADAVLSVWLPRGSGSVAVAVATGSGAGALTLAAAVLY